jgi:hypothetical protein
VLEFNDGNNELQQNRIEGSGSKILLGKSQEELEELAIALGEKKYRGRQLHLLIYKNKMNSIQDCAQCTLFIPFLLMQYPLDCTNCVTLIIVCSTLL